MVLGTILDTLWQTLYDIGNNLLTYIRYFNFLDGLDLLLVTILVFLILRIMRKSNAFSVLKGVIVILVVTILTEVMQLNVVNFLLTSMLQVGVLAIVIIFQPELRKVLGQMGSTAISDIVMRNRDELGDGIVQTVEACRVMAWERQGALIVFQRRVELTDVGKTGTEIDASITAELLKNIFYPKAPLHDGAVIIQNARITSAGCMLPLTNMTNISRDLGMRHRAGIGMSEASDAVVVMVSEETGSISVATNGMLKRHLTAETLEKLLRVELMTADEDSPKGFAGWWQKIRGKGSGDA